MKYLDIIQKLQNAKDYEKQKEYYAKLIGHSKVNSVLNNAKLLSTSLEKRYIFNLSLIFY